MPKRRIKRPLSVRKAVLIWIGCALAGWVVAIVSMYSVLRFGDTLMARIAELPNIFVSSPEDEGMSEIAPAAGESKPPTAPSDATR